MSLPLFLSLSLSLFIYLSLSLFLCTTDEYNDVAGLLYVQT